MDKQKEYEQKFDAQLNESRPESALSRAKKDTARTETTIEFYKRIQAARAASRKQQK